MPSQQYTIANGDRSGSGNFRVPGEEDGGAGDTNFTVDSGSEANAYKWIAFADNQWDVNVDVTVFGSHTYDESMNTPVSDGTTKTVASAGNQALIDGETPYHAIELDVNPGAIPSSGDLTLTFQAREL